MSVTNLSLQYQAMSNIWKRCKDVVAGQDVIHKGGEAYLPRLQLQDDTQYASYVDRTRFLNTTDLTIDGMLGLVFDSSPITNAPDEFLEWSRNVDGSGNSLLNYSENTVKELLTVGWCGTLIDYSAKEEETLEEAKKNGSQPLWLFYTALDITYHRFETINGKNVLTLVVLREVDLVDNDNEFSDTVEYKYKVLRLTDGVYTQTVYSEGGEEEEAYVPTLDGKTFGYIPFFFHNSSNTLEPGKPPLLDLVNLNLKHYQLKADHIHALHYVALPTPYILGIDPEDINAPSTLGPQKIWTIEESSATVGMLEYSGAGVNTISEELSNIEKDMASHGVKMIASDVIRNETATGASIRNKHETSRLSRLVNNYNVQLESMITLTNQWLGLSDEEETIFVINTDFMPNNIDSQMLIALVSAWQNGSYDYGTLFNNLKRGGIILPTVKEEDMVSSIESEKDNKADNDQTVDAVVSDNITEE